jgi:anti-sigma factor RsiW
MTTRQTSIDEDEFQAFVDGQLLPEQRRAVMAYLAATPDDAARMTDYRNLNEALHLLYDEVLYEPLPNRLRVERYRGRRSWLQRVRNWFGSGRIGMIPRLAGIAMLSGASAFGGWSLHGQYYSVDIETPAMSFTRQAAAAHLLYAPDLRHPVEFGADQQDSLLVWLSDRLGQTVHGPDLQKVGFALVGGRLLPALGQPAAQLMYENADAQRITLYIQGRWNAPPGAQDGTVSAAPSDSGISMVYWIEGPLAYALIGKLDREQLFSTAKLVQEQLQVPALPPATPAAEQTADKDAT